MTGEIGAVGDIITGALVAETVDPHRAGGGAHGAAQDGALCLNCGTRLIGAHCHACGQSGHVHRTVGAVGHEIAHGVFHFEGRMWRTLPMLALRPGELTRRYVAGERARFASPMAVFLFSVFLLFAVVANLPGWHIGDGNFLQPTGGVATVRAELATTRLKADDKVARYRGRLARLRAAPATADTASDIARAERDLVRAQEDQASIAKAQRFLPAPDGATTGIRANENWFAAKYRHATENPKLLLYKLKMSAYKYSWALIPISLPFIWLLFPRRRDVGFYDHAIFATYSLSFMSLLVVMLAVLRAAGVPSDPISFAAVLIPPVHIYRQLKGAYRLGWLGALWRTWWMLVSTGFTSAIFVTLLLYLGTAD